MSESKERFDLIFRKTLNLPPQTQLETVKYGSPANWDSIRHVELFISMQKEFHMSFSADEIVGLNSYLLLRDAFLNKIKD